MGRISVSTMDILSQWNCADAETKAELLESFCAATGHAPTLEVARGDSEFLHDEFHEMPVRLWMNHTRGLDGDAMLPADKGGDAVGPAPWVVRWKDTPEHVCCTM